MLVQDEHLALPSKAKVGRTPLDQDPAQEYSTRRPDVDSIAAPTIDVAMHVALDAVWDAAVCKGEKAPVDEERLPGIVCHVEGVATMPHL